MRTASPGLPLLLLILAGLLVPATASAQVRVQRPALELVAFERRGETFQYEYAIRGMVVRGRRVADVYLRIDAPHPEGGPPRARARRGRLLFDAINEHRDELPYSHPPLVLAVPEGWYAALWRQGVLAWTARREYRGRNAGVPSGRRLDGFLLESEALPALRQFRAIPYRAADRRPWLGANARHDSSFVLMEEVVLAPGRLPADVDGLYLREQAQVACRALLVEHCGRYMWLSEAVVRAEGRGDGDATRAAVEELRAWVSQDSGAHPYVRRVFGYATDVMLARHGG